MRIIIINTTTTFLCICGLLCLSVFAQSGRSVSNSVAVASSARTALVIGNGGYSIARKLSNPVNDANDIAATLKKLGFEVIQGTDLNLREMNDKVREFGDKLKVSGGVGLFYYAGHGIQVSGKNYLIPINADIPREDEIDFNAFNLDLVLRKMATANNGLNIIILDACRNNPFARSWSRGETDGGLAQITAPVGTFIAYATSPDKTAMDGTGRNGLYTTELLKVLPEANLKIEEAFKRVTIALDRVSGGSQVPWTSSSLRGEFYFNGTGSKISVSSVPSRPETPRPVNSSNPPPENTSSKVVKESFFTFQLTKCLKSGTMVSCDFTITNNDSNDKMLGFEWLSNGRVFDEEGNEGEMAGWQIANKSFDKARLLPDVPVKATFRFKLASSRAQILKRIELAMNTQFTEGGNYATRYFTVVLKDIELR